MSDCIVAILGALAFLAMSIGLWSEFRGIDQAIKRASELPEDKHMGPWA